MIDVCEFTKVEDALPDNYSQVVFATTTKDGNYKGYDGLYHNGFYWCGCLKTDVVIWRYKDKIKE